MSTSYRADLDGLRAIAIVSVVIFHVVPDLLPGGFAGVDIFFVISGYLISLIIMSQLQEKTFSFKDFYLKRIIRLFPALVLVLTGCLIFGWMILLPSEFKQLGKHTASSAGFLSNIIFYKEINYFDISSELKQLLHLWSLGIEEQFYFFWPFVLFITWRIRPKLVPYVAIVCICYSFGININKSSTNEDFAFYMPQSRFWELIIGGFLAYFELKNYRIKSQKLLDAIGLLGLILCLTSFFILNQSLIFPGWWALLPVIGTSLAISANNKSWINSKVLSHKFLVFIGLISYPLYLWHWPLLSFGNVISNHDTSSEAKCFIILLSLALAVLTYYLVEKPLKKSIGNRRLVPGLSLLGYCGLLGVAGVLIYKGTISPYSSRSDFSHITEAFDDWDYPGKMKLSGDLDGDYYYSQGSNPQKVIFIGDSHAEQYYPRVEKILKEHDKSLGVIFSTTSGCAPFPNIRQDSNYKSCRSKILNGYKLAHGPDIKNVVITSQWTGIFEPSRQFYVERDNEKIYLSKNENNDDLVIQGLSDTIKSLKHAHKNVYLILNIPSGTAFAPLSSVRREISLTPVRFNPQTVSRKEIEMKHTEYFIKLQRAALEAGATVINPLDYLCGQNSADFCQVVSENQKPIYKDSSHLRASYVRENISYIDQTMF